MHIIPVFLAVISCVITKPGQEISLKENEETKIEQEIKYFKKKVNSTKETMFEGLIYPEDIEEYMVKNLNINQEVKMVPQENIFLMI